MSPKKQFDIDEYWAKKLQRDAARQGNPGGWTPRQVGTIDGGDPVTFRQGTGSNEGHTLIADGEKSATEFDKDHNHYGNKREGEGTFSEDRGSYTGPGH